MFHNTNRIRRLFTQQTDRIYILPSKDGVIYLFLLALILLAAILNHINLTYFVLSIASGLFFAALFFTNSNLTQINVNALGSHSAHVGQYARIVLNFENESNRTRYNLNVELATGTGQKTFGIKTLAKLRPAVPHRMEIAIPLTKRGKYKIQAVRLSTAFPFGLFRAWSWKKITVAYFAYPMPNGELPLPLSGGPMRENVNWIESNKEYFGFDFSGHKVYTPGDSHRHINWKLIAKGYEPHVKLFNDGCFQMVNIDMETLVFTSDIEEKLSQVSQWIQQCCRHDIPFRVQFSENDVYTALIHEQNVTICLEKLAIWKIS